MKSSLVLVSILLLCSPLSLRGVKVHCNHPEKIEEEHIHKCCKHPEGHDDITEFCAKKTRFKLYSEEDEAIEDVTVENVVKGTCWAECVFDKFGFLKDGQLDMAVVKSHYRVYRYTDAEYEAEMLSAFDHCHGKSEEATVHFMKHPLFSGLMKSKSNCNPRSSVILSCVIYNFFHNCPRNRWTNSNECNKTLKFAKKCKDALTTM